MTIFIDIFTVLWQVFWATLCGIGNAVYVLLPPVMQLNKLASYFTPTGMVALYLGVPTVLVSIIVRIAKSVMKNTGSR